MFPLALCAILLSAVQDPFLQWMDRIAQQQLQRREDSIAAIRTVARAEQRQAQVRAAFLDILGGLPDYNGPLNARVTGRLRNESYTIEKILFESLPGYYVTANLYRPNGSGRYPAVLLQSGHTQSGKPEPHQLAANLAVKGFVALAFDPVGQGEREQSFDPKTRKVLAGWSVNEHIQAGMQCMLIGDGVARYFIWDAKRALDYLVSRPEVDAERLGCTGCSGGGALTAFIGSMDPRIKAAAPACYTNSFRLLFAGPNPDSEMAWSGLLARGLDMADYPEHSAPRPWLILATEKDFFTPPGARMVYEEARRWFRLYGAEDNVGYFVGPGPHGTPLETREEIYKWMIRWLRDGKGDFKEQDVPLYSDKELLVTPTGRVEDLPNSRKLWQLILERYHAKKKPAGIPQLLAELRRLGVLTDKTPPAVKVLDDQPAPGGRRQRIAFESEPGIELGATLYLPDAPGRKSAVLLVADEASSAMAPRLAQAGRVVLELQPRDDPSAYDKRPLLGNWRPNARADLIGRSLPAMRARDILRGVDLLLACPDVDPASIRGVAWNVKGVWLLLAAAADSRLRGIWLDGTPPTLEATLRGPVNTNLYDAVIPGFLIHWDLPDLVRAVRPRAVLWTDPRGWMGEALPAAPGFRHRRAGESDDALMTEFLR